MNHQADTTAHEPAEATADAAPTPETPLEVAIARVAHEVNRHYCMAMGDYSQVPWDQAPKWQQESAIAGVQAHLANPKMTPAQAHDSWSALKLATGWKYGLVKNETKKEHPCLVPYEELPIEQRAKDFIFKGVVVAIAHEQTRA